MNKPAKHKRYLSKFVNQTSISTFYLDSIYATLRQLGAEYPNFHSWFYDKVAKGIGSGEREIIFTISDDYYISGVVILKNTYLEKKICTIRVPERFQKRGVGKNLILDSLYELDTNKPLISVSEERNLQFKRLFSYFGFTKTQENEGHYYRNRTELVYNGVLVPTNAESINIHTQF